jgi:NAD+ diphosphatase
MFVARGLNRAHHRRKQAEWIRERFEDPGSLFIPVLDSRVLVSDGPNPRPVLLGRGEIGPALADNEAFFLGEENGAGIFAVGMSGGDAASHALPPGRGSFRDLRSVGALLSGRDGSLLTYAKTITYWHGRNRFCGVCGSPSASMEGGHLRACSNPDCGALHFPRTDPAIIVLIRLGNRGEKCLLGRQPAWHERKYSVIAGFVEPGESAEAAVVRESLEEAGVAIKWVYYHSSQPWPFPCSLMLAFTADAEDERVCPGDGELEDVRWFSRQELRSAVEEGEVLLPTPASVSFRLLEDWFDAQGSLSLRELAARQRLG